MKRKRDVFNFIAPVYGQFYNYQKKIYSANLNRLLEEMDLSAYKSIIDVGCGTGALCSVLNQIGFSVTGVDAAKSMLNIGAKKPENVGIEFVLADALGKLPFQDKNFDVSVASYVAHGLKRHDRKMLYSEMGRITKHVVIIYDYNEKRSILTNIAEWFEGGDYFNFIKKAKTEMNKSFRHVRVINAGVRGAWYICEPHEKF